MTNLAVSVGSSIVSPRRIPSSADIRRHLPRRRKLHILRFAFRGKSSVIPLLLLSPPNPLRWASAGPLLAIPLNPLELMFWRKPDVLCAYVFATVHLTRLSRLRCREANTLGVRSAYPLASACCTAMEDRSISATNELVGAIINRPGRH